MNINKLVLLLLFGGSVTLNAGKHRNNAMRQVRSAIPHVVVCTILGRAVPRTRGNVVTIEDTRFTPIYSPRDKDVVWVPMS